MPPPTSWLAWKPSCQGSKSCSTAIPSYAVSETTARASTATSIPAGGSPSLSFCSTALPASSRPNGGSTCMNAPPAMTRWRHDCSNGLSATTKRLAHNHSRLMWLVPAALAMLVSGCEDSGGSRTVVGMETGDTAGPGALATMRDGKVPPWRRMGSDCVPAPELARELAVAGRSLGATEPHVQRARDRVGPEAGTALTACSIHILAKGIRPI